MTLVMLFTIFLFLCYDRLVEKRQQKVLNQAVQSTAIVTSLFPKQIRDKLLQEEGHDSNKPSASKNSKISSKLKSFMSEGGDTNQLQDRNLAELYPHCTGKRFIERYERQISFSFR
jgi:hypothetical protein